MPTKMHRGLASLAGWLAGLAAWLAWLAGWRALDLWLAGWILACDQNFQQNAFKVMHVHCGLLQLFRFQIWGLECDDSNVKSEV